MLVIGSIEVCEVKGKTSSTTDVSCLTIIAEHQIIFCFLI